MVIPSNPGGSRLGGARLPSGRWCGPARLLKVITAALTALIIGGFPAAAGLASAAQSPGPGFQFSAEPYSSNGAQQRPNFIYELQAGHHILDQFVIKNPSTSPESFLVYGEDATNLPRTGGYAFQQRSQMHNTTVGVWLTVGVSHITVAAGTEVVGTFQLSIPANASPGDHVGGIVVEQVKAPVQPPNAGGVNVVLRRVIPMYVRVVGTSFPQLTIEKLTVFHQSPAVPFVSKAKVAVRFDLVNTGNEIVDPQSIMVSISGRLSGTIHRFIVHQTGAQQSKANPLPLQMLPGATLTLTEEWSGIPPFDPLAAHVSATAIDPSTGQKFSTAASTPFWYFPWIAVLTVLLLIVAEVALIVVKRRRKPAPGDPGGSGSGGTTPPSSPGTKALEQAAR